MTKYYPTELKQSWLGEHWEELKNLSYREIALKMKSVGLYSKTTILADIRVWKLMGRLNPKGLLSGRTISCSHCNEAEKRIVELTTFSNDLKGLLKEHQEKIAELFDKNWRYKEIISTHESNLKILCEALERIMKVDNLAIQWTIAKEALALTPKEDERK